MAIYKEQILKVLNTHLIDAHSKKEAFKVRAYRNAIESIKSFPKDMIENVQEISDLKGVGKSIKEKIQSIFDNPEKALKDSHDEESIKQLMDIHGIGLTKAIALSNMGIKSIEELRKFVEKDSSILNSKQQLGLQYAKDYVQRIERAEMVRHNNLIKRIAKKIPEIKDISIVGSYRRGASSSGDIDAIIQCDAKAGVLKIFVDTLLEKKYLHTEHFAFGEQKYLGLAKLPTNADKYRRIDLLVTNESEYPFALLYFTGSKTFNVKLRAAALKMGYTLNEHALTSLKDQSTVTGLKSEKDIIQFLGFKYIVPEKRC
jgi:DNA polymerase beta